MLGFQRTLSVKDDFALHGGRPRAAPIVVFSRGVNPNWRGQQFVEYPLRGRRGLLVKESRPNQAPRLPRRTSPPKPLNESEDLPVMPLGC
ncbi:hypothetical protein SAMN05216330_1103 [Bradyrhizobium sp. Ghvi]|nr:hypothetical protein SAMN05216330_1103 [Bradyrhizobium sp. Ghvi]